MHTSKLTTRDRIIFFFGLLFCLLSIVAKSQSADKIEYYNDKSPRLRGMMVNTNIDEEGLKTLAGWGANHVRWQLTWGGFPNSPADNADLNAYKQWLDGTLNHIDKLLPLCKALGIKVVLDLHTLPGGRLPNNNHKMFVEKSWQDAFVNIWKEIAEKYKDESTIWGYDIANEPQDGQVGDGANNWPTLAAIVSHEIRAIDKSHIIIIEARGGDIEPLTRLQPIDEVGIVYSFHMYVPHSFTHQNISSRRKVFYYPGRVGLKWWDKDALRAVLQTIKDWQLSNNTQVYIGEFSAIRWAPGEDAYNYLKDCIDIFEENNWSWAYHAFREYHGWSVEHGTDRADESASAQPTLRQRLFMDSFKKNIK